MAISNVTEIHASDVDIEDLRDLEEFVYGTLVEGELFEFLVSLIASLRAGTDLVLIAGDSDTLADLTVLSR